jgi:hypothetical protein
MLSIEVWCLTDGQDDAETLAAITYPSLAADLHYPDGPVTDRLVSESAQMVSCGINS